MKNYSCPMHKILQVVIKTKQKVMQFQPFHLIVMVLAEYSSSHSLFACHMMLAQTQQHFQTIVQLTHTRPTMLCIHLVIIAYTIYHTLVQYNYGVRATSIKI